MSIPGGDRFHRDPGGVFYRVVVNAEGCYCIWPTDIPVPDGWASIGFSGPLETTLNQVAELWHNRGISRS